MAVDRRAAVGRLETSPPVAQEELASWAVPTFCPACKGSRGVQPHKYYNTLKPGKKPSHSYTCCFSRPSGPPGPQQALEGCGAPARILGGSWKAPEPLCKILVKKIGFVAPAGTPPDIGPTQDRFFHKPQTCRHEPLLYSKITIRVLRGDSGSDAAHRRRRRKVNLHGHWLNRFLHTPIKMERSSPTKPSAFHYASWFGHSFFSGSVVSSGNFVCAEGFGRNMKIRS